MLIRREPDELAVTWAFSTDITKVRSGKEKRTANRRVPLEKMSARYFIGGVPDEADAELLAIRAALFVDPVSPIRVPMRIDSRPTTNAVVAATVNLDATFADWIAVGQAVYVEGETADDYLETTIAVIGGSVGARVLTLADSVPAGSFPAFTTTISPIATLVPDDRRSLARYQESHGVLSISGVISNTWAAYGTGASLVTHDGFPVLDEPPVAESDLFEEQLDAEPDRVESLPGAIAQTWNRDRADIGRLHKFNAEGEAERQWWRLFLNTVKGQQKAFLLPTWRQDLTFIAAVTTTLQIEAPPAVGAIDYVNDYFPSLAHRRLMVARTDGSVSYYTVTAAVDNLDGTANLTLSVAFDATGLDFISLLETCRLAEDEISFERGSTAMDLDLPVFVIQQATEGALSTFADYEKSVQASSPIELVKIVGAGVAYYMTGERASISYGGNTYLSTPGLSRAELERTGQDAPRELEVALPMSCTFAQEQAFNPSDDLDVTVYRQNGGGTTVWQGPDPVSSIAIRGKMLILRAPSRLDDPLRRSVSSAHVQGVVCNHDLGDAQCQVLLTDHDLATTVVTASGRTITVASVAGFDDGDLNGGEAVLASGARKMIASHVGTTLVLASAFKTIAALDVITLIRACDKAITTCRDVFSNVENWGGHHDLAVISAKPSWWKVLF